MSDTSTHAGTHADTHPSHGKNGASDTGRMFGEATRATGEALQDASRKATAAVSDLGKSAYDVGTKARDEMSRQVEAQPMMAVLVAASLGLLTGLLLARR